ncbi:MAG: RDD family protein [Chloroflexota bacterium]|nr:RDD family protein [Chloroflexota bacterium]
MNEKQQEPTLTEYAGFWIRFVAYLIDGLILSIVQASFVPLISFGFIQPWFWWVNSFSNQPDVIGFWFIGTAGLFLILIPGAYFVAFWTRKGQTPGKMAMGIKVLSADGSRVTVEKALLRYLGYLVCTILWLIPFLWVALDSRKQGIQDKFAATCVMKVPRS